MENNNIVEDNNNIIENKLKEVDKTMDNIITDKINEIMEKNPNAFGTEDEPNKKPVITPTIVEDQVKDDPTPPESWVETPKSSPELVVDQTPELITPVAAQTFRRIDSLESKIDSLGKDILEVMNAALELTKSHDSLVANIQSSILEKMTATPKKARKQKVELYSENQLKRYDAILSLFEEKSGKSQRDLTNGVNQKIAAQYGYTVGKIGKSNTADHILSKVAKDYSHGNPLKEDYSVLDIDSYLEQVISYVLYITGATFEDPGLVIEEAVE